MEDIVDYSKELIKVTMKDLDITLTELSEKMGKDKSQIYRILNSDSDMTLKTLDAVFTAMGVKVGFTLVYD